MQPSAITEVKELRGENEIVAPELDELKVSPPHEAPEGQLPLLELAEILDQHRLWAESRGESGRKADLCGVNLARADLTGVNLQGAFLHKANLSRADLSMANLQDACLVQADLRDTNLLGTELRGANLMGAKLYGAEGLWVGRLGGTNLFDAMLPESIHEFSGAKAISQATKTARWHYLAMLAVCLLFTILVGTTSDLRLLKNSAAVPVAGLDEAIPLVGFFLGAPLLLFCLYSRFLFLVLRLWGNVAALPAVFPDGQTLEKSGPWYLMGLARGHFRWLRENRSPLSGLEWGVAMLFAYWAVPATLIFFWLRYLTRQDLRGTVWHIVLVMAAVAAATCLPIVVARVLHPSAFTRMRSRRTSFLVRITLAGALAAGCVLTLLSVGVLRGIPPDANQPSDQNTNQVRRWVPAFLGVAGYRPYANLNEAEISTRPAAAIRGQEDLDRVQGAAFSQLSLRYARGYRAYLANARLWKANLEGSYFAEADLRGANLREAILRGAVLDHALAARAVMVGVDASHSNFADADLQNADLSYAVLEDSILAQAKLGGARMYGANLRGARLPRARLEHTDLREANLENAVLSRAILHETDLSSAKLAGAQFIGAQLQGAILLEADLRRSALHGAVLQGAVVREAHWDGADLGGADLRGALGLTAGQVCSASNWRSAQLDADLLQQVELQCGGGGPVAADVPAVKPPVPRRPR